MSTFTDHDKILTALSDSRPYESTFNMLATQTHYDLFVTEHDRQAEQTFADSSLSLVGRTLPPLCRSGALMTCPDVQDDPALTQSGAHIVPVVLPSSMMPDIDGFNG